MIIGAVAVIFGFLGICVSKIQIGFCTFLFGLTSFLLAIVYTTSAVAIMTLAFTTDDDVTKFCTHELATKELEGFASVAVKDIDLFIDDIDSGI